MFKILDGSEQFYQWDLNRQLLVQDASITEVHFCNRTEECSLVVEVKDGVAEVPNILLQDNFRINVYCYDGEATKHSATFGIIPRSKPADYVYTETEIKNWEELVNKVDSIDSIKTITLAKYEKLQAQTLEAGIYKINVADESLAVVVLGKTMCAVKGNNNMLYLGGHYTEAGVAYFDKPYVFLYTGTSNMTGMNNQGVFRGTKADDGSWSYKITSGGSNILTYADKVYTIDDTNATSLNGVVCPKAVADYFKNKIKSEEDFDYETIWAEDEIYNANTVNAICIEIATILKEKLQTNIEALINICDDFRKRIEALENK